MLSKVDLAVWEELKGGSCTTLSRISVLKLSASEYKIKRAFTALNYFSLLLIILVL